jgi:hypothetical protein
VVLKYFYLATDTFCKKLLVVKGIGIRKNMEQQNRFLIYPFFIEY